MPLAIVASVAGSVTGALFNYYFALFFGRSFLQKYGKYIFVSKKKMNALEEFFKRHGELSTFNGRLIPGIRQLISLPAGLAKMAIGRFVLYTALGAGIWSLVLTLLGYILGRNATLIGKYATTATVAALVFVALTTFVYIILKREKS